MGSNMPWGIDRVFIVDRSTWKGCTFVNIRIGGHAHVRVVEG